MIERLKGGGTIIGLESRGLQGGAGLNCRKRLALLLLLFLAGLLSACHNVTHQIIPTGRAQNLSLQAGTLKTHGLALLTPSTVTGQEEDRQALALAFSGVVNEKRPEIRLTPLSETLGLINRNGLSEEYREMFQDSRFTGIFRRETLKKLGEVTGARYLAQLKLANFNQRSSGRFSTFGLRIIKTEESNIRLFLSIWDSWNGSVAWEGMQELNHAYETWRAKPITFKQAVDEASKELIKELP